MISSYYHKLRTLSIPDSGG